MRRRKPTIGQVQKLMQAGRGGEIDGLWWIAVKTTGVYCRPTCTARQPKPENALVMRSAAECEAAGFRACMRCHPESAPHLPVVNGDQVCALASLIDEHALSPDCLSEAESAIGVSIGWMRDEFTRTFGATPEQYLDTSRRHLDRLAQDPKNMALSYRPPYNYQQILDFLGFRAIRGIESVRDGIWSRTFAIGDDIGWVEVRNDSEKSRIILSVSDGLASHLDQVTAKARRLFDVDCDPKSVRSALTAFRKLLPRKHHIDGIRLPCSIDPFEMAVRAIIGQQITVKAANTLAGRMARAFGMPISTPIEGLTHAFPSHDAFLADDAVDKMVGIGIIESRGRAISALAKAIEDGIIKLGVGANAQESYSRLLDLPGIGPWTANYILMRAFHHTDGFPASDYGVKVAFPGMKTKEIEMLSQEWRPYRSYAVMSLWCAPHDLQR